MSPIHRLWKLTEKIRKEEIFPSQWEEEFICPVCKKRRSNNVRELLLHFCDNMAYEAFSVILFKKLQPIMDTSIGNYQSRFRLGKFTSNNLHSDK